MIVKDREFKPDINYNVYVKHKKYEVTVECCVEQDYTYYRLSTYVNGKRYGIVYPISNDYDDLDHHKRGPYPLYFAVENFRKSLERTLEEIA